MGNYTEVLLTCSAADERAAIVGINYRLLELGLSPLGECLSETFPRTVWGMYQKDMVVADFVSLVNEHEWKLPRSVQVFVRGEHDERFSEIEIDPKEKPPRQMRWTSARLVRSGESVNRVEIKDTNEGSRDG